MRLLTKRFQSVNVVTVNALRDLLERISCPEHTFVIENVARGPRAGRVDARRGTHKTCLGMRF
jgi:hypothetical protein